MRVRGSESEFVMKAHPLYLYLSVCACLFVSVCLYLSVFERTPEEASARGRGDKRPSVRQKSTAGQWTAAPPQSDSRTQAVTTSTRGGGWR